jgi:hypothetical protein
MILSSMALIGMVSKHLFAIHIMLNLLVSQIRLPAGHIPGYISSNLLGQFAFSQDEVGGESRLTGAVRAEEQRSPAIRG